MRVLHVPFTYFPSSCGGTEVYVSALCRELAQLGVENVVAAPDLDSSAYVHDGIPVRRFAVDQRLDVDMLHAGVGDPVAAAGFARILDEVKPDIVHFHARSPTVSCLCLDAAQDRGLRVVYTYHTPTATCRRGTLMRWGETPCDGQLTPLRCAACHLHALELPRLAAWTAALLSPLTQIAACLLPDRARWQLPARALTLTAAWQKQVRHWLTRMDAVIALNQWSCQMLAEMGVSPSRLHTIRHGLAGGSISGSSVPARHALPLRLAFLGRLDPTKGLHVILEAMALVPDLPMVLDLFTLVENPPSSYAQDVLNQARLDPRVQVRQPLSPNDVVAELRNYDALLVPSLWLETGPLVVLESFAAGIPVIGSDLGGIAEWVKHETNGLLVPPGDALAWRRSLERFLTEPELRQRLRQGIIQPPQMTGLARTMALLYQQLLPS